MLPLLRSLQIRRNDLIGSIDRRALNLTFQDSHGIKTHGCFNFDAYIGCMKVWCFSLLLFVIFANAAFAQNDTLVYFVTSAGAVASDRQAADYKLVIFPVGSGAGPNLSAIKGFGKDRKLAFSGSSLSHKLPITIDGVFTEYYPEGGKKSVKAFNKGDVVANNETDFYPNGNVKTNLKPASDGDVEEMDYYETGTVQFEHHPTGNHNYTEKRYYPDGKTANDLSEGSMGKSKLTQYYETGKVKCVETSSGYNDKSVKTAYFPNGNVYYEIERKHTSDQPFDIRYLECRDSTGKQLVQNGNGYWREYDESFDFISKQGKVVNGNADSVWTLVFSPNIDQRDTYHNGKLLNVEPFETEETLVISSVATDEKAPEFPGGREALNQFIGRHAKYPAVARENNTQGRVVLSFTVEKDGTLSYIKIVAAIGDGCDEEAERVLKMSPAWIPGTKNGVPVRTKYSIPIYYTLIAPNEGMVSLKNH